MQGIFRDGAAMESVERVKQVEPSVRYKVARVVTEISSPVVLVILGLVVIAIRNADRGAGAAWVGVAIILCAALPMGYVIKGVRAGRWTDHHVGQRDQRAVPLLVAIGSVAIGALLLVLVHAPSELTAIVLAELAGLVVVLIVTQFWKISIHAATAGGLLGVFLVLYGPWALVGLIPLAVIAWSRTVLDAHTVAQVTVGAATGFAVAVLVFSTLR